MTVEVVVDDKIGAEEGWRVVFDGDILLTAEEAVVGNYVAGRPAESTLVPDRILC